MEYLTSKCVSIVQPTRSGERGGIQLRRPIQVVVSAFRAPYLITDAALNVNEKKTTTGFCMRNLHSAKIDS